MISYVEVDNVASHCTWREFDISIGKYLFPICHTSPYFSVPMNGWFLRSHFLFRIRIHKPTLKSKFIYFSSTVFDCFVSGHLSVHPVFYPIANSFKSIHPSTIRLINQIYIILWRHHIYKSLWIPAERIHLYTYIGIHAIYFVRYTYTFVRIYIYTHSRWLCLHTNTIPIFKRISYDFLIFAHPEIFLRFSSIVCVLLLFSTVQSV